MFFSTQRTGLGRILGGAHNPNINQQNGGVKKEQVKGCGSVNRPTPGSQRPAEPVATGFFGIMTSCEKCGSVNRPWHQAVGCVCQIFPALSHSVRRQDRGCGVCLLSAGQAERPAVRRALCAGESPPVPPLFSPPLLSQGHLKNCVAKQKNRPVKTPRPRQV